MTSKYLPPAVIEIRMMGMLREVPRQMAFMFPLVLLCSLLFGCATTGIDQSNGPNSAQKTQLTTSPTGQESNVYQFLEKIRQDIDEQTEKMEQLKLDMEALKKTRSKSLPSVQKNESEPEEKPKDAIPDEKKSPESPLKDDQGLSQ